ncbi:hypothetical protein [Neorhizobium alkalisoli]|uniref:Uncharacterized protein n=1 Tax=Neorhizobium alkalisoli TaxID=528178 RepID=A0A561PYY8_9HYPH|nr:hypothetical protein [Neorhizobium alkalisoli]TWF43333.1 hypothetical protein FHW37_1213 [Neorhizobium alkalisoli]
MDDRELGQNKKASGKVKPLWPWIVILMLTLIAIYAYQQALVAMEDLARTGSDFAQLFKWLVSLVVNE